MIELSGIKVVMTIPYQIYGTSTRLRTHTRVIFFEVTQVFI